MAFTPGQVFFLCAVGLILLARPAAAFGAGNIASLSKVEGVNWRHGDIEDTLLTIAAAKAMSGKKFGKLDVKRVYFGNWLRDYSQAIDVGTVKHVSAEAIRILLWVLGFMSFGYGTGEFEVTTERLGCYRPEEHIDNPKDYAENEDARQYDRRLRGPVDERRELAIDPESGLKNYIANEGARIDTSAALVRNLLGRAIDLGRKYNRSKDKKDLYETLRLIGTASHCLEDYAAHSNYVELALIEMGERDVFPHVGRNTAVRLRGARNEVWPIVTGTFGGVDFLHSVCGEFSDKATSSEIKELENALNDADKSDGSFLQELLSKVPSALFGGKDEAGKVNELQQNAQAHQMQNTRISPRQPEEWARYLQDVQKQIYPIMQWHDEVMQSLTETIEKLPILPDLIEQIQDEINKFVFTLLAPYVVPVIRQISNELETGSSEIIGSSKAQQHVVFNDDRSSDPTHSMLSKDHFSNVLNEPAGRVASGIVKWVMPQIVEAWDNDRVDISRTLDRIINGVLHHPALRDQGGDASEGRRAMFSIVEKWWQDKDDREKRSLRDQLSRRGVQSGANHKEGVEDHGHGSARPKGQRFAIAGVTGGSGGSGGSGGNFPISGAVSAVEGLIGGQGGQGGQSHQSQGGHGGRQSDNRQSNDFGKKASEAAGGGLLGGIVGGIASAVGGELMGGGDDRKSPKKESHGRRKDDDSDDDNRRKYGSSSGGYSSGRRDDDDRSSGRRQDHGSSGYGGGGRNDNDSYGSGHGSSGAYGSSGGYGTSSGGHSSSRRDDDDNRTSSYGRTQGHGSSGGYGQSQSHGSSGGYGQTQSHGSSGSYGQTQSHGSSGGYGQTQSHGSSGGYGRQEQYGSSTGGGYGSSRRDDDDSYGSGRQQHSSSGGGYGRQQESSSHGGYGSSRRDDNDSYGSSGGYGRQQESSSGGGYGSSRRDNDNYGSGRQEYGSGGGYGQQQQSYGQSGGYGQQEQSYGSGGGYGQQEQSYGQSGGYGRRDDNDNDYQSGGYGRQGQGQGQGGYGGSGGGYGNDSGYGNDGGYGGRRY